MRQPLHLRPLRLCVAAALLLGAASARSQVFVVDGGTSTLYQAQGGSLKIYGPSYNASVGAGVVAGRFVGGATLEKSMHGILYTGGSQILQCNLPTDLFNESHQLYAIGGSVRAGVAGAHLLALAGATSTNFGGPFFQGMRAQTPVGVLLADRAFGQHMHLGTQVVVAQGATTAFGSLVWKPGPRTTVAFSGGASAHQPYGAVSVDTSHRLWDLKAAYLYAGDSFHRVGESNLLSPEPVRENLLLTIRPTQWLSLSVGRQNSLAPQAAGEPSRTPTRSVVQQAGVAVQWQEVHLSASVFESTYAGRKDESLVLTAGRQLTQRIHAGGSYFVDHPQRYPDEPPQHSVLFLANAEESLSPRWTISEVMNRSHGQGTYGMGGSFLSNFATVTVDYQTYYVPARLGGPYEQAVIVNLELNLPGGMGMHGGTFVGPDGKLLYTAEARGMAVRGMAAPATVRPSPMGRNLLHGCVVDTAGKPVMGAALLVQQTPVFTDSRGCFALHERHARVHPLAVMVDQFMDGGHYRVVSAPQTIRSSTTSDGEPEPLIVVALVPRTERPV